MCPLDQVYYFMPLLVWTVLNRVFARLFGIFVEVLSVRGKRNGQWIEGKNAKPRELLPFFVISQCNKTHSCDYFQLQNWLSRWTEKTMKDWLMFAYRRCAHSKHVDRCRNAEPEIFFILAWSQSGWVKIKLLETYYSTFNLYRPCSEIFRWVSKPRVYPFNHPMKEVLPGLCPMRHPGVRRKQLMLPSGTRILTHTHTHTNTHAHKYTCTQMHTNAQFVSQFSVFI